MYDFIEVNLLPAEYRVRKRNVRLEPWIVWPALGVVAVLGGLGLFHTVQTAEIEQLQNRSRQLDVQIRANAKVEQEINKLEQEKKTIVGKIMALERISVNRAKWVRLLEIFCRHLPQYSWLVSMTESDGTPPKLTLQGKTRSFPEVATYMADLRKSIYVTNVELTRIEQMSDAEKVFGFEIVCTIDPDAGLTTVDESKGGGI
ncbi:MAG: hypothetical protein GF331_04435 [Chitinivibrionales bacterium]|nr:hypothetical protein [Chitinivibrionales bacterium]